MSAVPGERSTLDSAVSLYVAGSASARTRRANVLNEWLDEALVAGQMSAIEIGGKRHDEHRLQDLVQRIACHTITGRRPVCSCGR